MKPLLLSSILVGAVLVAYWGSFPGTFHYDDFPLMLGNPHVTDPSFRYADFAEMYGGRPLTAWTFHANYLLGGESALGYHLVSVVLHGIAVILLFHLLLSLGAGPLVSFSTSLLFAVHPALVQSVNYVWARSILLMTVLGLSALLLGKRHYWASLGFWQLAMLSRVEGMLFLVPLALLNRRYLRAGLLIAAVNLAAFAYGFKQYAPAEFAFSHSSWLGYWLQAPASFWHYIQLFLFPAGFSIYHGFSPASPLTGFLSAAGLILLGAALLRCRKTEPELVFSIGWILLFLAPSLLVPNAESVSESRMYAAGAGFCAAAAVALTRMGRAAGSALAPVPNRLAAVLPVMILTLGALAVTVSRHPVWKDDVAIWREAVERVPDQPLARYNLGAALSRVGATAEARKEFEQSSRLNPEDDMSYAGLGFCAETDGQLEEAQQFYETALTFNPENSYAREGLTRLTGSSGGVPRN